MIAKLVFASSLALATMTLSAAAQSPPAPYGAPITLEAAKKAMAAAEAEAVKNNWQVVIAIVDSAGQLVMMQRMGAQYASIGIAEGKAKTSVDFRRPTKALEDVIASGGAGLRLLSLNSATPLEGGIPIIADGKIIGGIGVSGVTSQQDAQVAKMGADAAIAK